MRSFSRLLIAVLSCTFSALAAPEVQLGNTTVVGMDYTLTVGGLFTSKQEFFGGIPYAEPPLGDLRLKPTVLKTSLGGDTFNASQYGPSCLQPPTTDDPPLVLDEDCLTINIIRPANISADAKLPVLFWTYGGGFQAGSTPIFNASAIVALSVFRGTPVVYVSFNYRTGPLGFPQGAEAARRGALNLALHDQLTALEWVQRNIGIFGGDKTKIFESGQAATPHLLSAQDREKSWTDFVGAVPGCASVAGSNNTFDCLKTANTSSILQGLVTSIAEADELFAWDPTVDGNGGFIPDLPSRLFENGTFAKLPFIAGTNLDEGQRGQVQSRDTH
ncbi:hypothetical protein VNI00_009131 [Paramarasmius palmivorus]|uniref:Carboxylesterase type B domain-containing protein n=1 Tax=Paramarasmius palmivorus TaxID=297713 RepID=A0AAW0CS13_9AGAR